MLELKSGAFDSVGLSRQSRVNVEITCAIDA